MEFVLSGIGLGLVDGDLDRIARKLTPGDRLSLSLAEITSAPMFE